MMESWKPYVVETTSSEPQKIDLTAKINEKGDELTLYVVNLTDQPQEAIIGINNFVSKGKAEIVTLGDCALTEYNTADKQDNVVPRYSRQNIKGETAYTFPKYSYTMITLHKTHTAI